MPISNTQETRSKFGVPVTGTTGSGILHPKLKYRFRVTMLGGFGGRQEARIFTQNVQSVSRPTYTAEEVVLDSYNSKSYVQGKHAWETIQIVVRDDMTSGTTKLVGAQIQRQLNHFQQTTPAAGNDYKFDVQLEVLDGANSEPTEVWFLEGCFLQNVTYGDHDYSDSQPVQITMTVRYDNATQYEGSWNIDGRLESGNPFPDSVDLNSPGTLS